MREKEREKRVSTWQGDKDITDALVAFIAQRHS